MRRFNGDLVILTFNTYNIALKSEVREIIVDFVTTTPCLLKKSEKTT